MKILEYIAAICAIIGLLILIIISYWLFDGSFSSCNLDNLSKLGSFCAGYIGVLFSLAAFLILFATLKIQQKQISESNKLTMKQAFETHFFQMITTYTDTVRAFTLNGCILFPRNDFPRPQVTGHNCFNEIILKLESQIPSSKLKVKSDVQDYYKDLLAILQKHNVDVFFAFNQAIAVLDYIKSTMNLNIIEFNEAIYYTSIFHSRFSTSEEILFYYYFILNLDKKKRITLNKLCFFQNLSDIKLLLDEHKEWLNE